jgi:hypothetical protein
MSDHTPFPEDDRSRTPFHGDALLRASFDKRCVDLGEPGHAPPNVVEDFAVEELSGETALIDSCPACWTHWFLGGEHCRIHSSTI